MIDERRIDVRCKGFPPAAEGLTIAELVAGGYGLRQFSPPIAALDERALANNLRVMADFCARRGLRHAPHAKTTMSPQLVERQLAAGAWGMTVATIHQARVLRAHGVRRILLANQLVDPVGVEYVRAELAIDPDLWMACFVDSLDGVRLLAAQLRDGSCPLNVYVEVGADGGRAGCRTIQAAVAVGQAVAAAPGLRLAGVAGWEGVLGHDREQSSLQRVRSFLLFLGKAAAALRPYADGAEFTVTAGGSAYFDLVADELAADWTVVLRSGCVLLHDNGYYARATPLSSLRPALRVWAHVLSSPEADLAIVGLGRRDVGFDNGLPLPELVWRPAAPTPEHAAGLSVTALNDQHAFVRGAGLEVGDLVGFGISHPCTTVDKWRLIPILDHTHRVVDGAWTYF